MSWRDHAELIGNVLLAAAIAVVVAPLAILVLAALMLFCTPVGWAALLIVYLLAR